MKVFAILVSLIVLSGCVPIANPMEPVFPSVPEYSYEGESVAVTVSDIVGDGTVLSEGESVLVGDGEFVDIFLGGSSSCPPVIAEVLVEGNTVRFVLSEYAANMACTADYGEHAYRVEGVNVTSDTVFEYCVRGECVPLMARTVTGNP